MPWIHQRALAAGDASGKLAAVRISDDTDPP